MVSNTNPKHQYHTYPHPLTGALEGVCVLHNGALYIEVEDDALFLATAPPESGGPVRFKADLQSIKGLKGTTLVVDWIYEENEKPRLELRFIYNSPETGAESMHLDLTEY